MSVRPKNVTRPGFTVRNLQRAVRFELKPLQRFAESALGICLQLENSGALHKLKIISVLFISDRRMAQLHRQFLQKAGATDVITFQHGEIFISAETARDNALRFGTTLRRELCLYIVHGLLHLAGFDDTTPAAARKMEATQEKIFSAAMEL
jgi:probable rRNA maturation factor